MKRIPYILIIGTGLMYSCRKPFSPVVTGANLNNLVVEGFINTGTDSTIINLSRTVTVGNKNNVNPETKAVVTVENSTGSTYTIPETATKGTYATPSLNLNSALQYRLRIKTSNGKIYLSDFVMAKVSPPIDSIGYKIKDNGVVIYTNTHDPNNNTRYYKYTCQETWLFNAKYMSNYVSNGTAVVYRLPAQQIYTCFGNGHSVNIIINTTASLSKDMVYQFPVASIDSNSEKIETKYSILLTQYPLTKEGYAFWSNLKKNTEDLGSIFDAQPTVLTGNVHNIADASEPVIGYISAGTKAQKRIFITRAELQQRWATKYPYDCQLDSIYNTNPNSHEMEVKTTLIPLPPAFIPVYDFSKYGGGYMVSTRGCADCTVRGYTQTPGFWK